MTIPPLAVENPDGSRAYVNPVTGERAPSITTVLKCISKPQLDGWAARATARYAAEHWDELDDTDPAERLEILKTAYQQESQPKADRGTLVHELCEMWAKGTPGKVEKSVDSYMTQFFRFLGEVNPEYVEAEGTVWNRRHEYAGTFDAIAVIDGHVTLVEIKTGRGVHPEFAMQMAAQSHGEFMVDAEGKEWELPQITRHALLHLRPRSWRLIPVYEVESSYSAFLAARRILRWHEETAKDVFQEEK